MLPLFFSGLLSYLVVIKRKISRHVQERLLTLSQLCTYILVKLYLTFILHWIAFIFGRDKEEDQ